MRFRADWRAPLLWMLLGLFNVMLAVHRFHKDGWHSSYPWFQLICWSIVFIGWSLKLAESWHFEKDQLIMKRFLLPDRNIPYASITSIDWTKSRNIVVTLSESSIVRGVKKRYVMVRNTSGFLGEMEHHVAPDILHI